MLKVTAAWKLVSAIDNLDKEINPQGGRDIKTMPYVDETSPFYQTVLMNVKNKVMPLEMAAGVIINAVDEALPGKWFDTNRKMIKDHWEGVSMPLSMIEP